MRKYTILIIASLFSSYLFADDPKDAGFAYSCEENESFSVRPYFHAPYLEGELHKIHPNEKIGYESQNISCSINKEKFIIIMNVTGTRSGSGACSGAKWFSFSLFINGKMIVNDAAYNNGCIRSVDLIEIKKNGLSQMSLVKLCGEGSYGDTLFKGCTSVNSTKLLEITHPSLPTNSPLRTFLEIGNEAWVHSLP